MAEERGDSINQIKLIAVGDSGVGKTSILTRFTYEKFNDYSEPTLGAAFLTKKHTLPTGKSIEYHVSSLSCRFGIPLDRRSIAPSHPSTIARPRSPSAYMISPRNAPMMWWRSGSRSCRPTDQRISCSLWLGIRSIDATRKKWIMQWLKSTRPVSELFSSWSAPRRARTLR